MDDISFLIDSHGRRSGSSLSMPLGGLDEEKICFSPNCFAQTCKRIKCRNYYFSEKQYFVQRNVGTPTFKERVSVSLKSNLQKSGCR
ncbi:hypothetical protein LEP1GSC124_4844 [Leptospira interrogans serovar Pyrogenes str. 200701872]|uniref:Uncharacterized protein n=2 Tax=Leptospira interrogans serovar Pyrogenes TaxID=280500 RepID=M6ZTE6_LEPIR|nr:hypothetical protein LEP1GSC124_4844 [Leptospira interrogans serovar Pyrogenes str. 200701872]